MALHTTGIYSKPSGKTGGVVWGRARTRYGKLATSREYVIPTYSNTPDQIAQRAIFLEAIRVSSNLGNAIWRDPWNNTLGELAGYSAFMSHLIHTFEYDDPDVLVIAEPPPKSLGPVYMPDIQFTVGPTEGRNTLSWDAPCYGDHCHADDTLMGFRLLADDPHNETHQSIIIPDFFKRSGTSYTFDDAAGSNERVYIAAWFQHEPGGVQPSEWSPVAQAVLQSGT